MNRNPLDLFNSHNRMSPQRPERSPNGVDDPEGERGGPRLHTRGGGVPASAVSRQSIKAGEGECGYNQPQSNVLFSIANHRIHSRTERDNGLGDGYSQLRITRWFSFLKPAIVVNQRHANSPLFHRQKPKLFSKMDPLCYSQLRITPKPEFVL